MKQSSSKSSLSTLLQGAFWSNTLLALTVAVCLTTIVGSFCFPVSFGLRIVVPYFIYCFLSRDEMKDGNGWSAFSQKFIGFRCMRQFLQLTISPLPSELVQAEKKPDAQFILAMFPHGVNCDYRVSMDGILETVFPNVASKCRALAASILFRLPVVREITLWTHCIDARRVVAEKALDQGRSILILPGGLAEQIRTEYGKEIVYVRKRKGFIKLAMRKNVPVVPSYVFGVSDYYHTSRALFGLREWLVKNLGICITFAAGFWKSPFCPFPVKTTIVFGKPLMFQVAELGKPTNEEVDAAHRQFCVALQELFEAHKTDLGYGDRELQVL